MADLQPGGTAFHIVHHDAGRNGGDLWEVLEQIFDLGMDRLEDSGLSAIFHNLVNSARLVELFKGGPDSNPEAMEANRKFLKLLYEHVNKEKCDLDHQEFSS